MDDMSANPAEAGSDSDPVSLIEAQLEREQNPPTMPARDQKPEPEPEIEDIPDP